MSNKIILKAEDLDGYLTSEDLADLKKLDGMFKETMKSFDPVNKEKIIEGYDKMGHEMHAICKKHPRIKVYSFETEQQAQADEQPAEEQEQPETTEPTEESAQAV